MSSTNFSFASVIPNFPILAIFVFGALSMICLGMSYSESFTWDRDVPSFPCISFNFILNSSRTILSILYDIYHDMIHNIPLRLSRSRRHPSRRHSSICNRSSAVDPSMGRWSTSSSPHPWVLDAQGLPEQKWIITNYHIFNIFCFRL